MRTLYNSFVYPYFTYCIEVWGNVCPTHLDPLVKIQKRAIRTIVGAKKFEHTEPIFRRLKLLNLHEIYIYFVQLFMYKYHNGILPFVFNDLFVLNASVHTHYTRQHNQLHVPRICSTLHSRTVRVNSVALYNYFDRFLSMRMTYDSYKYNLKNFIRENGIGGIL